MSQPPPASSQPHLLDILAHELKWDSPDPPDVLALASQVAPIEGVCPERHHGYHHKRVFEHNGVLRVLLDTSIVIHMEEALTENKRSPRALMDDLYRIIGCEPGTQVCLYASNLCLTERLAATKKRRPPGEQKTPLSVTQALRNLSDFLRSQSDLPLSYGGIALSHCSLVANELRTVFPCELGIYSTADLEAFKAKNQRIGHSGKAARRVACEPIITQSSLPTDRDVRMQPVAESRAEAWQDLVLMSWIREWVFDAFNKDMPDCRHGFEKRLKDCPEFTQVVLAVAKELHSCCYGLAPFAGLEAAEVFDKFPTLTRMVAIACIDTLTTAEAVGARKKNADYRICTPTSFSAKSGRHERDSLAVCNSLEFDFVMIDTTNKVWLALQRAETASLKKEDPCSWNQKMVPWLGAPLFNEFKNRLKQWKPSQSVRSEVADASDASQEADRG